MPNATLRVASQGMAYQNREGRRPSRPDGDDAERRGRQSHGDRGNELGLLMRYQHESRPSVDSQDALAGASGFCSLVPTVSVGMPNATLRVALARHGLPEPRRPPPQPNRWGRYGASRTASECVSPQRTRWRFGLKITTSRGLRGNPWRDAPQRLTHSTLRRRLF
jgi:hypothetical protein